jgi:guanylate kinase
MFNIIAIIGVSGSGKTRLASDLESVYPDYFCVPQAFTTRERRNSEDTYVFLNEEQYQRIRPSLIGRTSFNNKSYGTLLTDQSKVNVMILDIKALEDLLVNCYNYNKVDILFLERTDYEKIAEERPDRSLEFIINEAKTNKESVSNLVESIRSKQYPSSLKDRINLITHDVSGGNWFSFNSLIHEFYPSILVHDEPTSRYVNQD